MSTNNLFRGLFEKDKLVFSFMICTDIMKQAGHISDTEWNFFLRGSAAVDGKYPDKPPIDWLSEQDWKACCDVEVCICRFKFASRYLPHEFNIALSQTTPTWQGFQRLLRVSTGTWPGEVALSCDEKQ